MENQALFPLILSVRVALTATLFVVVVGGAIAYFLARRRFRGKELLDTLLTLPLVLPPTVTGYYLIVVFGRNGVIGRYIYQWTGWTIMFTWQAAALASFVVSLPLMIKTARSSMESVDEELIQASYTLGHSEWRTSLAVIIPLAKKGIMAGAVLSFARAMGEFGATLMLAGNISGKTNTMPLAIYSAANSGNLGEANFMALLFTVMAGVFLYTANKLNRRSF